MRVVVTGASGFIGRAIVRALVRRAVGEVIAVSRARAAPTRGAVVTQVSDYDEAPRGDIMIHLAETRDLAGAARSGYAHLEETVHVLGGLLSQGHGRVVYASSAAVYGDAVDYPHRTDERPVPTSQYGQAKLACEEMVLLGVGLAARLANVYGPGMAQNNVISDIVRQIPGSGPVTVRDTKAVRDYLWIDDAAEGMALLALSKSCGVFNLGSGVGTSVAELARTALAAAGEEDREVVATAPDAPPSAIRLDISDTILDCGWSPATDINRGLARLIDAA